MDAATFRAVLGQWPTGVTVVTTVVDGVRHGVTASSFSSVSLDPPLVSVCLARTAFAHDLLARAGVFGVAILAKDQAELGQRFARFDAELDRFAGEEWETAKTGAPLLATALGWLDCAVAHAYEGGDHTIFVGEVLAGATPRTTSPLLYHSRTWGQFADQLPGDVGLTAAAPSDLVVEVAGLDAAARALMSRADVHDRPRVVLTDAFAVAPADLGLAVAAVAKLAPAEVVLADQAAATPLQVREACREAVLAARPVPVAVRLTDAGGLGQANLLTALKSGVSLLDLTDGLDLDDVRRLLAGLGLHLQGDAA